jgi:hypothetical protein
MQLDNLAEIKAHDGQRDDQREKSWAAEQCPEKQPPRLPDLMGSKQPSCGLTAIRA